MLLLLSMKWNHSVSKTAPATARAKGKAPVRLFVVVIRFRPVDRLVLHRVVAAASEAFDLLRRAFDGWARIAAGRLLVSIFPRPAVPGEGVLDSVASLLACPINL